MQKTFTAMIAAVAVVGFAGAALAGSGCGGWQSVHQSTPIETAQVDGDSGPQTPKPAETN